MKHSHFKLLESLGLHDGKYLVFSYHMNRLIRSARYFNFTLPINLIKKELLYLAGIHSKNSYKVRLTVNYLGKYNIEIEQIQPINSIKNISLAKQPINSKYPFLYHKTTWREVYEKRRLNDCSFDTLLWNDNKQLTEFTIGNLVVQKNQKLFTPPINSGLLNGTYRASLIDTKIIEEKILHYNEIQSFEKIWLINSVRGWIEVKLRKK